MEFKRLWCTANLGSTSPASVPVACIDKQLHADRAIRGGGKVTFQTRFEDLPPGAFIELGGDAFLYWAGELHRWSAYGYSEARSELPPSEVVTVLTPVSIVRVLQRGFAPQVHESACGRPSDPG